jgi:hypothetical protein
MPGYKDIGDGWAIGDETWDRNARIRNILMDRWERRIGFFVPETSTNKNMW